MDIQYDTVMGCYTLHFGDQIIMLAAETYEEAEIEAESLVGEGYTTGEVGGEGNE
jgi:hypothetical protein